MLITRPPMGWNSWNTFGENISEELIMGIADAMVEKGLGISIMPELLLTGRHDDVVVKELVPPSKRVIGLAITETSRNSPATRKFADYTVDWVRRGVATV